VIAYSEGRVSHDSIIDILGVVDRNNIFAVSEAIIKGDLPNILDILDDIYDRGQNMLGFYTDLIEQFRNLIVVTIAKDKNKLVDLPVHEITLLKDQAKDASPIFLNQVFELLFNEEQIIRSSPNPKMAMEMVFVKLFQIKPVLPIDVLIEKIDTLRQDIARTPQSRIRESRAGYDEPGNGAVSEKQDAVATQKDVTPKTGKTSDGSLEESWRTILGLLSEKHPSLAASLTDCSIHKVSDTVIEIEVNGSGYTLEMVKKGKNETVLKTMFSQHFGRDIQLTFKTGTLQNKETQKKKSKENRLKQEAFNHPLVSDAIEIFDGKIVDVKIL